MSEEKTRQDKMATGFTSEKISNETIECDCPFCPLVEKNLNVVNVLVDFRGMKQGTPLYKACKDLELPVCVRSNLAVIVFNFMNDMNVGGEIGKRSTNCQFFIKQPIKNYFKISFETNLSFRGRTE